MKISFRLLALTYEPFAPLFSYDDAELAKSGVVRHVVTASPGMPCRVSLADAEIGETVLLVPYRHLDSASPYRAMGPIFVRENAVQATPIPDEIPLMFHHRLISVRGYDDSDNMIEADVVAGGGLEATIWKMFANSEVRFLHLHNARPGCYNCRVERV